MSPSDPLADRLSAVLDDETDGHADAHAAADAATARAADRRDPGPHHDPVAAGVDRGDQRDRPGPAADDRPAGLAPELHVRPSRILPRPRVTAPFGRVERGLTARDAKQKVRDLVLEEVAPRMAGLDAASLHVEVRDAIERTLRREDLGPGIVDRRTFADEVMADILGFGPLDPLLHDDSVSEIMCNAFDDVWVEREGRIVEVDTAFEDDDHYRQVIERIVSAVGRRVDEASPMVDARLADGSRVNAVVPPLAVRGPVLTIRKFAADPLTAADLVERGTYTPELVKVLEACVRGRLSMLVSGGTGTGKTTSLNVMSSFVPGGERIITIEDSAELQLQQRHVVSLESRPPNAEGRGAVMIRDLVGNALRMRPDRIIIGECRSAEALDMLQAMNTGHEGSMTTVHANSPRDALSRLETMVLMAGFDLPMRAIREQIAAAIDLILHVERLPNGRRVVTALTEVQGLEGEKVLLQDVFRYRPGSGPDVLGTLEPTGLRPAFAERLREQGADLPAAVFRTASGVEPDRRRRDRRASVAPAANIAPAANVAPAMGVAPAATGPTRDPDRTPDPEPDAEP